MRSYFFLFLGSLASCLVACGGGVDVATEGSSGSPAKLPAPAPTTDPARPNPSTPVLPLPDDTLVVDPNAAPAARVGPLDQARLLRCGRAIGNGIVAPSDEQGAYETTLTGNRLLASGALVGGHRFNSILGALGEHVFISTWSGSISGDGMSGASGVVSVHVTTGEVHEVAPLRSARSFHGRVVPFAGQLYGVESDTLVRFSGDTFESIATSLTHDARLLLNDAGLFVVDAGSASRVTSAGLVRLPSPTLAAAFAPIDVHTNGDSFYANGERLYRSGTTTALVKAPGPITSVRIDAVTGKVFFGALRKGAPMVTSLYALDGRSVTHVVEKRSSDAGMGVVADEIHILEANEGQITFSARCSGNPYESTTMPIRVDAESGALTYRIDDPAYPYVTEVGWMYDRAPGLSSYDVFWRANAGGVSFFVRR